MSNQGVVVELMTGADARRMMPFSVLRGMAVIIGTGQISVNFNGQQFVRGFIVEKGEKDSLIAFIVEYFCPQELKLTRLGVFDNEHFMLIRADSVSFPIGAVSSLVRR